MTKSRIIRILFIALGCCCIIAAAALTLYNMWTDAMAGRAASQLTMELTQMIESAAITEAYESDANIVPADSEDSDEGYIGCLTIDGYDICGSISIPAIGVELAVINNWTPENLDVTVCRYSGLPNGQMVLVGHNYDKHLGKMTELVKGDEVIFTDINGNRYNYAVTGSEVIPVSRFEDVVIGKGWDLTLFTCTYSGTSRLTVRCVLAD